MTRLSVNQSAQLRRRSVFQLLQSRLLLAAIAGLMLILAGRPCVAQVKRIVLIKCDGLPYDVVDRFVKERDPRTGKSALPWIDYIFYQHGARLSSFYVRGMSL